MICDSLSNFELPRAKVFAYPLSLNPCILEVL
jgi:hypothetical protein